MRPSLILLLFVAVMQSIVYGEDAKRPAITQASPGFPYPDFSLQYYPETVMPGDRVYYVITAKNPHAESIHILHIQIPSAGGFHTQLTDSEGQRQLLLSYYAPGFPNLLEPNKSAEIKPGDSRTIGALAINVPPLEDWKEPFWEKRLEKLPVDGERFLLGVTVPSRIQKIENDVALPRWPPKFEVPLMVKSRPEKEMTLIANWLSETPKELLPVWQDDEKIFLGAGVSDSVVISVQGKMFSQWKFLDVADVNRYPADPNAPATWQGWKELEDSLTPSTMRDEIRLTRIFIQYCDTKDEKVLAELKEWFDKMNEVQRTVMSQRVLKFADGSFFEHGSVLVLYPRALNLYRAIREYDVVDKLEWEMKRLKNRGLIE